MGGRPESALTRTASAPWVIAFGPIALRTACSEGARPTGGSAVCPGVRATYAVEDRLPVQAFSGTPAQGRVSIRVSTAR
ncbi:hypothetical protein A4U61_16585 [Streptomyces sp. H-KF8]|jgi:hypothetical protein|nr:hypothetical protein A4U61_16585 [Streptomyces sp. H-KF8]